MLGLFSTALIPIIFCIILYVKFRANVTLWEYFLQVAASLLITFSIYFINSVAGALFTEYYGSVIVELRDNEEWDEYIYETCTESYACGTDSKGNTQYCTRTYDCSYVDYHAQYYQAITSTGESFRLNHDEYFYLLDRLGRERMFVDMLRDYHDIDGDRYVTTFDNGDKICWATTSHLYENRIKASDLTIFNLKKVTEEQDERYRLHDYPKLTSEVFFPSVVGANLPKTNEELSIINGIYGKDLQVRNFLWVYYNQPPDAGRYQEYKFVRGNKNEIHICVGVNDDLEIKWVHPFTWSKTLNTPEIRNEILELGTLSDSLLSEYIKTEYLTKLQTSYERREFEEFSYIEISIKIWVIVLTWVLVILANLFLSYYVVNNEYDA